MIETRCIYSRSATGRSHIMSKYIDVLSVNVMGPMNSVLREMEQITTVWNGPILIADTGRRYL